MKTALSPQDHATGALARPHRPWLITLVIGIAPALGCALDPADDAQTAEAQQPVAAWAAGLDFGGAFGYVAGAPVANPATGGSWCPAGYTATSVLGTTYVDYPVTFCSRPRQAGVDPIFDFGGMWGYVNGALVNNPITGRPACPAGYADQTVLDTTNVDYPLHVCYRAHVAGTAPDLHFGGMWGYVDRVQTANPATGAASCPAWHSSTQVLGTSGVDYPVHFCWQYQAGKFTAQAQVASVGPYTQVTVGVTISPSQWLSYLGHAGGLASPGANGTWGDLYTDDVLRLYLDTVSFEFNTLPFYTNVNFFDASSNFLGSYHGGGVGVTTGIGGGTGTFSGVIVQ